LAKNGPREHASCQDTRHIAQQQEIIEPGIISVKNPQGWS